MKINKKKLFLAVLMASGLFTSQQALANDTSQKNIEAKLNSAQWKGLKPSRTGGDNIAFVDKASLNSDEVKEIKTLGENEKVDGCTVYKLVYEKNSVGTTNSTKEKIQKILPKTGDVIGWGHLVGAGILAGLAFFLIKNKKGRKFLVIALIGGGSLVYAMQDTGAYSGTEIKETTFIASDQELKTPEIDGYHFVGVIKLEDACVFNTPSDETPADNQKEEKPKTEKPNNKKEEQPKTEKPDNKKEEKPKSDNPKTNKEEQTVKPAEIQFNFTKAYHGGTLKAGQFKFEIRDSSGKVVQTATNDEKGNILFQSIKFKDNEVGTHTYTISEVKGTEENTEYDKMVSTVTVTVTKSDDKLVAKITKIVSANGIDGKLKSTNGQADTEFNNSYIEPITVAPSDHLDD
ncbi:pilin isopeptide linkage protein [Gemella sanguinis M325]|uniref:LPXTG cell wall anchor domain-containing protein n=1 Tax=Gemella sanguinis TaxID=84135 RepID=A0ABX6FJD3_9BACL|nr:FctA domain-containing protein [Gemella sanguinis]EPC06431.1 pilin isopeptide linkage protein [Gemella sanguinis M325]QGS07497.1 LPXTG cell wall anchor domain-containing protein [Gemella sanguinis]